MTEVLAKYSEGYAFRQWYEALISYQRFGIAGLMLIIIAPIAST